MGTVHQFPINSPDCKIKLYVRDVALLRFANDVADIYNNIHVRSDNKHYLECPKSHKDLAALRIVQEFQRSTDPTLVASLIHQDRRVLK